MSNNISRKQFWAWVSAARLRTLPLAAAAVGMGSLLQFQSPKFSPLILLLTLLTTVFLQVLSNFANDLGDSDHGADNTQRKGPSRMVQSGLIDRKSMQKATLLLAILSLVTGMLLLWLAFRNNWIGALPLFMAGLSAISAAWFYTNGSKPYGYRALGDIAVFIFFGLLAVLGSAWLQVQSFSISFLFPAFSMGFWSMAVLNLNNMRDVHSDALAGKRTVPMLLGEKASRVYHFSLVAAGAICLIIFALLNQYIWVAGAIPGFLLMIKTLFVVVSAHDANALDKLLKPQAAGTFLAVLGMGLGLLLC